MSRRLGVGIIGLGRRWQRYRAALSRVRQSLVVRAVFDPVAHRAETAAKQLGCTAAPGCLQLLERSDVEVILLLDRCWFGLWPLECACVRGQPVFCALALTSDDAHADNLRTQIDAAHLPVMMADPLACSPALGRLRDLLRGHGGSARLVRADCAVRTSPTMAHSLWRTRAAAGLVAICSELFDAAVVRATSCAADSGDLTTMLLDYGAGRTAQISLWTAGAHGSYCRIEAVLEHATATVTLPNRLRWRDANGHHSERRPCLPLEVTLLDRFGQAVRTGEPPRPDFEDAFRNLTWLRHAWQGHPSEQPATVAS
jgi:predicted dehydrogenase